MMSMPHSLPITVPTVSPNVNRIARPLPSWAVPRNGLATERSGTWLPSNRLDSTQTSSLRQKWRGIPYERCSDQRSASRYPGPR